MNYTHLDEAYKIHHVTNNTYENYNKKLVYNPQCIFCSYNNSIALMEDRDGGIFRRCLRCRKEFVAKLLTQPINNYNNSTEHLKGTN